MKKISFVAVEKAEKVTKEAADRLLSICLEEDPESSIELLPGGEVIGRVAVSVDGTWQKRGNCSKNENKDNCDINHSGSSDKMETNGTMDIFLCSMEKTRLKYVTFVVNGDSASFVSI